jgi:hypothetical protein
MSDAELFAAAMLRHAAVPQIPPDIYLSAKEFALGLEISQKTRIFLDTRYWLLIRDHVRGNRVDTQIGELLTLLRTLVHDDRAICPVAAPVLGELLKQTDSASLALTFELVDDLSASVAIQPELRRLEIELRSFLATKLLDGFPAPPLQDLVWTRPFWITVGVDLDLGYPPDQQEAAEKAFIDLLWECPFSEYAQGLHSWNDSVPYKDLHDSFPEFTKNELNIQRSLHPQPPERRSFHTAFMEHLEVALYAHADEIESVIDDWYEGENEIGLRIREGILPECEKPITEVLRSAFRDAQVGTALPYLRILPGILTAFEFDHSRKVKRNDLADMYNAASALPYCNIYLTEGSFQHLLTRKPLQYDSLYSTQVISNPAEALDVLMKLL